MNKSFRLPRRARVTKSQQLTTTGTYLLSFRVVDDQPFDFYPCQFVAIDCESRKWGYRRSPYCISSPPNSDRSFQLLVRRIPTGPVSLFISELEVGDVISFRGPTGASMIPKEPETELILIATGVGLSPFASLLHYLLPHGFKRKVRLYWGLRLPEDICLTEKLDALKGQHSNFDYRISVSRPTRYWRGLHGRVSESVPPLLDALENKHFYLSCNGAMIAEWSTVLSEFGVARSLLFEEYFFNFNHQPDPAALAKLRSEFGVAGVSSFYERAKQGLGTLKVSE